MTKVLAAEKCIELTQNWAIIHIPASHPNYGLPEILGTVSIDLRRVTVLY